MIRSRYFFAFPFRHRRADQAEGSLSLLPLVAKAYDATQKD